MPGKRIAVTGAGVSGLGAIKSCLEEGLEPTCFEGSHDIGGLWRYEEKTEDGRPSIYKSATSNTCKEMTAYSDFPFPDHHPNYGHNSKILEYLRMYTKHFHLMKYIQFLSKVHSVRKHSDFPSTGQWDVVVEAGGKQKSYVFDGIMVCSGLYADPVLPLQSFPVLDSHRSMFKLVFPPQLEKPTLVFIGILQPVGATIPTSELQSRSMGCARIQGFLNNPRDSRRVQYVDYVDELASEIRVKPNLFSLLLWDPKLAMEVFFGPCTPYQYHLQGPGKWDGARKAILTQKERFIKPLRTRILSCGQPPFFVPHWLKSVCAALLFILALVIIRG